MTAGTLLKAAALMRDRAYRTTPGPWSVPGSDDEFVGPADVVGDGVPGERYVICEHAGMDAIHIASWHPEVALPVADLLTAIAERVEAICDASPTAAFGLTVAEKNLTGYVEALALSAAYLGNPTA